MNKEEVLYQKFRQMGYDHQQARELALKAAELERQANANPKKLAPSLT